MGGGDPSTSAGVPALGYLSQFLPGTLKHGCRWWEHSNTATSSTPAARTAKIPSSWVHSELITSGCRHQSLTALSSSHLCFSKQHPIPAKSHTSFFSAFKHILSQGRGAVSQLGGFNAAQQAWPYWHEWLPQRVVICLITRADAQHPQDASCAWQGCLMSHRIGGPAGADWGREPGFKGCHSLPLCRGNYPMSLNQPVSLQGWVVGNNRASM